ncbi:DciA family protein [Nocardioides sp. 616]|uniref:DUF721 domain-containing protein n=1 Tax=Nocardioides sp. 616 TaxID=2268090 RepID=UPI000CE2F050|nr:DciA family protein [Nocardioides sp. 616]
MAEEERPDDAAPQRRDDGLDLARSAARAAARIPGQPARRKGSGKGSGTGSSGEFRRRVRPRSSGAHPDDRDPQLLGSALDRLVTNHGWAFDLQVQGVFARWSELVGAEVGAHCTPETLTEGKLVVRTDSTAWATQLRMLAPTVVRRLNEELGDGTVAIIEVLGPNLPSWKKGLRSTRGRGPRDTYG